MSAAACWRTTSRRRGGERLRRNAPRRARRLTSARFAADRCTWNHAPEVCFRIVERPRSRVCRMWRRRPDGRRGAWRRDLGRRRRARRRGGSAGERGNGGRRCRRERRGWRHKRRGYGRRCRRKRGGCGRRKRCGCGRFGRRCRRKRRGWRRKRRGSGRLRRRQHRRKRRKRWPPVPRCQRALRGGRRRHVLRSLRLPPRQVLHADRHLVQLHQRQRLLLRQLHPEPVHVCPPGLLLHRPRSVLQRLLLRERYLHLPARHPRVYVAIRAAAGRCSCAAPSV